MPVKAHWAIGKIERAHAPLRRTFDILKAELGNHTSDEDILQMAVKAINDTAGPKGLVPTLLIFGAYPRINLDSPPLPDIIARANAIRKAIKMLQTEQDKASINRAINTRNGPIVHDVLALPLRSKVIVYREKGRWTGPYPIKAIENQNIILELGNGPVKFRCTQVKPYYRLKDVTPHEVPEPDKPTPALREPPPVRRRGRPPKDKGNT